MKHLSQQEFEKQTIRDAIIISVIGLLIFLGLVLYGFKLILGL